MNIAQKCTGCAHLLDGKGSKEVWKTTRCADACPTEALKFGEEADLKELIAQSEIYKPELKTKPRVHYIGIPKQFIGGTVYDPKEKEVIIGATVNLVNGSKKLTTTTDGFGDFWFEGLAVGNYHLVIEAQGYEPKAITDISTEKSVNLGDIPVKLK
jgi:hypothetical protein